MLRLTQRFASLFTGTLSVGFACGLILLMLGELYWIWMALKYDNFWMFVAALLPPFFLFTMPMGAWSMVFGPPQWLVDWFT